MLRGLGVLGFILLLWQSGVFIFQFPEYILPSPLQVGHSFIKNWQIIFINFLPTLTETLLGLLSGILLGMGMAFTMMNIRWIRYWLMPILIMSQAIPTFALAPLLVIWFGYGMLSKILTVMLMLFFPVASAFYGGLRRTPLEWLEMAQIMHGKKFLILWYIRLPAALPHLGAGIKVATALAPIGAIISEWVGASHGLGFLMLTANARLDVPLVFACVMMIMLLSLCIYGLATFLASKFMHG